jgi:hypothetical protein
MSKSKNKGPRHDSGAPSGSADERRATKPDAPERSTQQGGSGRFRVTELGCVMMGGKVYPSGSVLDISPEQAKKFNSAGKFVEAI